MPRLKMENAPSTVLVWMLQSAGYEYWRVKWVARFSAIDGVFDQHEENTPRDPTIREQTSRPFA